MHDDCSTAVNAAPATSPQAQPTSAAKATLERERRGPGLDRNDPKLRHGLSSEQLTTLDALEAFRWRLAFVRRPMFRDPIPVLFDRDNSRYVVINGDGSLDESGTLTLRD